jgi:hypothetical protein
MNWRKQMREKIDLFQVGVRKLISIIQTQVVMGCNLFIFWFQVILELRITGWNKLIGHPKDRGKDDSNSRTNSRTNSFQPSEINAGENQTQDLKIISRIRLA